MRIAHIALSLVLMGGPALAQAGTATAPIVDLNGKSLGTLTLTEMDGGVHITGELSGLPGGEHGIHIHETGTCDAAAKFKSAGAHFEPAAHKHGSENPEGPHAGDLPNVSVAAEGGGASVDVMNASVTLSEGESSLLDADGSAIVIHADPDDYQTDPSGNSGERIACGVVSAGM